MLVYVKDAAKTDLSFLSILRIPKNHIQPTTCKALLKRSQERVFELWSLTGQCNSVQQLTCCLSMTSTTVILINILILRNQEKFQTDVECLAFFLNEYLQNGLYQICHEACSAWHLQTISLVLLPNLFLRHACCDCFLTPQRPVFVSRKLSEKTC